MKRGGPGITWVGAGTFVCMDIRGALVGSAITLVVVGGGLGAAMIANAQEAPPAVVEVVEPVAVEKTTAPAPVVTPEPEPVVVVPEVVVPEPVVEPAPAVDPAPAAQEAAAPAPAPEPAPAEPAAPLLVEVEGGVLDLSGMAPGEEKPAP